MSVGLSDPQYFVQLTVEKYTNRGCCDSRNWIFAKGTLWWMYFKHRDIRMAISDRIDNGIIFRLWKKTE